MARAKAKTQRKSATSTAKKRTTKADNKTQPTQLSVEEFVAAIEHPVRRADAQALLRIVGNVTGWSPKMWGSSIIGYGRYHYQYESGREGDAMITGFSPRKANLVMYIMPGYSNLGDKLDRLGKHKLGKSCLYLNKLADVDVDVLEEIIRDGVDKMKSKYAYWPE